MVKSNVFKLASICLAMVLLMVQSAKVVNEYKIDTNDHMESVRGSKHDRNEVNELEIHTESRMNKMKRTASSMQSRNGSMQETGMVSGESGGGPGQTHPVMKSEILKNFCSKCRSWGQDWNKTTMTGWTDEDKAKCIAFSDNKDYYGDYEIELPQCEDSYCSDSDSLYTEECFAPHVNSLQELMIGGKGAKKSKRKSMCGCLKTLVDKDCRSPGCTDGFFCSCTGLCHPFKEDLVLGSCQNSLMDTYMQSRSATPLHKALLRKEGNFTELTASQQALKRKDAASLSKQDAGTLDETLEEKCPAR